MRVTLARWIVMTALAGASASFAAAAGDDPPKEKPAEKETAEQKLARLLDESRRAMRAGELDKALDLTTQAIAAVPDEPRPHYLRGLIHENRKQYAKAAEDYSAVLKAQPKNGECWQRRGTMHFFQGKIAESIKDFDRFIALDPKQEPHHWQRGICYYYAGEYAKGVKQFDIHQTVNSADVENAVWRFLCQARLESPAKAQADLLKIGQDSRVPMKEVYELFAGRADAQKVLEATEAGTPTESQKKERLFFAHLYLGLHHEAHGRTKEAEHHLKTAAEKYNVGHYMWQVARVHVQLLEAKKKTQPPPAAETKPPAGN